MSEDLKGASGAPVVETSGSDTEAVQPKTDKDVVAYDTYRKAVSELKRFKEASAQNEAAKLAAEEKLMSIEGKKDELIGSLNKRLADEQAKVKKVVGAFGHKTLASVIAQEAAKEGCVNVGDLIALSDLSNVEIDDEFNVNVDQVREVVQRAKKERNYLFAQKSTAAKTGVPMTGVMGSADDWKKLPLVEQAKMALAGKIK